MRVLRHHITILQNHLIINPKEPSSLGEAPTLFSHCGSDKSADLPKGVRYEESTKQEQ